MSNAIIQLSIYPYGSGKSPATALCDLGFRWDRWTTLTPVDAVRLEGFRGNLDLLPSWVEIEAEPFTGVLEFLNQGNKTMDPDDIRVRGQASDLALSKTSPPYYKPIA